MSCILIEAVGPLVFPDERIIIIITTTLIRPFLVGSSISKLYL